MDTDRIELEDALKHIRASEERGHRASLESLAGSLHIPRARAARVLSRMQEGELATHHQGSYALTAQGRDYALQLVRAHRLYETYLARRTSVPETEWHRAAHDAEHRMSREEVNALARDLGFPRFDPHGDPIPKRDGQMHLPDVVSLLDQEEGWEGRLVHVEDEPDDIYKRLVTAGFAAGMRLKVLETFPAGRRVNLEGRVIELSLEEAANLECASEVVEPVLEGDRPALRLSAIPPGETVVVEILTSACRGAERRRLLDLGMVPGSLVEVSFSSPFSSPRAYRVRGSLIGLRREQAEQIIVRPVVAPKEA